MDEHFHECWQHIYIYIYIYNLIEQKGRINQFMLIYLEKYDKQNVNIIIQTYFLNINFCNI